jgi:ABC-2 type transport system permease protein
MFVLSHRIRVILRKELRQTVREPRMRALLVVPLILELLFFGYAVNLDLDHIQIAWMDRDNSPASRALRDVFLSSINFSITATPADDKQAQRLLDRGEVLAVVSVLPGFARDLERGRQAAVQVQIDGSNSNTAALVSNYATQIINGFAEASGTEYLHHRTLHGDATFSSPRVASRSRVWFNEELKSRNYLLPGVLVNLIMVVTMTLTILAVVREKEIGTMEQLMVTPIRPSELIIGKTVPFAIIGICQIILVTTLALAIFRIPFRGSAFLLLLGGTLFILNTLFISTIAKTQQQAALSAFLFVMPAFLLSGFAFPIQSMPVAFQYATYLNPARYFMEIVRGIFLKGSGFAVLWPQLVALLASGIAILGFSVLRFRKRID